MQRAKPPFRADEVGSLLRSRPLKEARAKRAQGAISAEELRAVEDRRSRRSSARRRRSASNSATDGEFRRAWWHLDFFWGLAGCERLRLDHGIQFHGIQTMPEVRARSGKLGFPSRSSDARAFPVPEGARAWWRPKITIPAPSVLHFRRPATPFAKASTQTASSISPISPRRIEKSCMPSTTPAAATCNWMTPFGPICARPPTRRRRGSAPWADDPTRLPEIYPRVINPPRDRRPPSGHGDHHPYLPRQFPLHLDRGGRLRAGSRAAPGRLPYDGFFLEYDTERAGGFEPLRFLPKGRQKVVLGLVTSKFGALEREDDIRRRIDEATKYVAMEQICLSPQCGFASTEEGNILAEEQQWAKLRMIVELAQEVWG